MATNFFNNILNDGISKGMMPALTAEARNWYRSEAEQTSISSIRSVMNELESKVNPVIGRMILFNYFPKHADKLPYWDRFPLVFPFSIYTNGFYGINFHYLPLEYRAKLMDGLYDYISDTRFDQRTRLRLSYELLTSLSKLKYFRPCVKHYLNTSLRSRLNIVPASKWDIALFLPLEKFEKTNKENVYRDSRKIIRGY